MICYCFIKNIYLVWNIKYVNEFITAFYYSYKIQYYFIIL